MKLTSTPVGPEAVSTVELNREVNRRLSYSTTTIVWIFLSVYPFFSILDYVFAEFIWQPFLLVRAITALVVYMVYRISQARNGTHQLPLHFIMGSVSLTYGILCNLVDFGAVNTYFLTLSAIFLLINATVTWPPVNSYLHTILAIGFQLLCFYLLNQRYSLLTFFQEGGAVFLVVAFCSAYIPRARYRLLTRAIKMQLMAHRTNEKLQDLNGELLDKNQLILDTNAKLQRINEQKNDFILIASHDLKNLVSTIRMSVSELQSEEAGMSADQQEYVGFISDSSNRMQYLLNKLFDVKEIEGSEIAFNYELTDLNRKITQVANELSDAAARKDIELSLNILPASMMVRVDRIFAKQIFTNLLANVIRFSQPANTLTLRTDAINSRFVFELIDHGQTIGQTHMERLFNKLDELSYTNISSPDRTGLGLSIALRLTEAMDGKLTYASDPRIGNYYRVEFPLA
jgi:signal transduction histidine kinase